MFVIADRNDVCSTDWAGPNPPQSNLIKKPEIDIEAPGR